MANRIYDYDEMLKKYGVESTAEKPQSVSDEEWERYRMAYLQKTAADGVDAELAKAKEQAAVSQELARGYLAQYLKGTGLANLGVSQKAVMDSEANYNNNLINLGYAAAAEKRQIDGNYSQGLSELSAKWADKYLSSYNSIVGTVNSQATAFTADAIKEYVEKNKGKAKGYEDELDGIVAQAYKQEEENYKKQLAAANSSEALSALNDNYSADTINKFSSEYKQKEDIFYPEGKGKIVGNSPAYKKMNNKGSQRLWAIDYGGKTYELKFTLDKDAYNQNESAAAHLPDPAEYSAGTILEIKKDGETTYWYRGNTYEKWYRMTDWKY